MIHIKPLISWTSKIQIKKGTPILSLIKHLREAHHLQTGKILHSYLVVEEERPVVKIYLDGQPK